MSGREPVFYKIGEEALLDADKWYECDDPAFTHIGVYRGKIAFFTSGYEGDYHGQKWHLFVRSEGGKGGAKVKFSDYNLGDGSGYHYGKPVWGASDSVFNSMPRIVPL